MEGTRAGGTRMWSPGRRAWDNRQIQNRSKARITRKSLGICSSSHGYLFQGQNAARVHSINQIADGPAQLREHVRHASRNENHIAGVDLPAFAALDAGA